MQRISLVLLLVGCVFLSQCMSRENDPDSDAREVGMLNPSKSGMELSDPNSITTIKRGMVVKAPPSKKMQRKDRDLKAIYRFIPFDQEEQQLRLTTASPNEGKGFAEDKEIDLTPYANKMIEVQGSSFSNRWVFDAVIVGQVVPDGDTTRARADQARGGETMPGQTPATER